MRDYSLAAIKRLLALSKIVVRKNRRGEIVAAQYRPECGANPLRLTAFCGTRYSFLERIHESRLWSHRRLLPRQDLEQLAGEPLEDDKLRERYLQAIFRAVPLSCIRNHSSTRIKEGLVSRRARALK